MKKLIFTIAFAGSVCLATAQINLNKAVNSVSNAINNGTGTSISNDEIVNGLKEALSIGSNNSTASASKLDGFNRNPKIKIPFPKEAQQVKTHAEKIGMKKQVDKFVLTLNRAAEEASKEAAPIFLNAIKTMSVTDGVSILKGSDNAATNFLNEKTNAELMVKFKPIVQRALKKVEVTKQWNPLVTAYNKVPGTTKMNPDLEEYVTLKAMEGLFILLAEEELKIRKDPSARVTDLLKKVFG
jgi:hypothetical protein